MPTAALRSESESECDLCRAEAGGAVESPWPRRRFRPVVVRMVTRETADRLLATEAELALLRARGGMTATMAAAARTSELRNEERRLRAYGFALPIDRLVHAFDLSGTARELLVLLAAANRDPRIWAAARAMHADPMRLGIDCAIAERLLGRSQAALIDAARELIGAGLVRARTTGGLPLQLTSLFVEPRVVDVLRGHTGIDHELEGVAELTSGGYLVVRAAELPHDVAAFALVADAIVREARLADAIVVIDDDGSCEPTRTGPGDAGTGRDDRGRAQVLAGFVSAHGTPCVIGA